MKYLIPILVLVLATSYFVVHASASQLAIQQAELHAQQLREDLMRSTNQPYTARFLIFTNGTKRILSLKKYLFQSPDAYLRSDGPTIVHVTKRGTTWQSFFHTLPLSLNNQCLVISEQQQFCNQGESELKLYLNGQKVPSLLSLEIHDGDRALISYGSENDVELKAQLAELAKLP